MTSLPQAAIDAAVDAVMADRNLMAAGSRDWAAGIVQAALPAAAPHIAAAERAHIRQFAAAEAERLRAESLTADDMTLTGEDAPVPRRRPAHRPRRDHPMTASDAVLVAALRAALARHMPTELGEHGLVCAGCLCPAPCPDADLLTGPEGTAT